MTMVYNEITGQLEDDGTGVNYDMPDLNNNNSGTGTYTGTDGYTYIGNGVWVDAKGNPVTSPNTGTPVTNGGTIEANAGATPGSTAGGGNNNLSLSGISSLLNGTSSYGALGQLAGIMGISGLLNSLLGTSSTSTPKGYQGSIPKYTAVRQQLPVPDRSQRRPGSGGITYFSPMQYLTPGQAAAPVDTTVNQIAKVPSGATLTGTGTEKNPYFYQAPPLDQQDPNVAYLMAAGYDPKSDAPVKAAQGGIMSLGGYSAGGRLLNGPGDGVSDSIPATIGNKQPARLADGEFVVDARTVSELGNGSTKAGAQKLYQMMSRVHGARKKAGRGTDSKADKYLPA